MQKPPYFPICRQKWQNLHLHPFRFVGPNLHAIVFLLGVGLVVLFFLGGGSSLGTKPSLFLLVCVGYYWWLVCFVFLRLIFSVSLFSPWLAFLSLSLSLYLFLTLSLSISLSLSLSYFAFPFLFHVSLFFLYYVVLFYFCFFFGGGGRFVCFFYMK